jgi:hypothetical protein
MLCVFARKNRRTVPEEAEFSILFKHNNPNTPEEKHVRYKKRERWGKLCTSSSSRSSVKPMQTK